MTLELITVIVVSLYLVVVCIGFYRLAGGISHLSDRVDELQARLDEEK